MASEVYPGAVVAPRGILSRIAGIVVSPRATFESVARFPHWLDVLVLVTVLTGACLGAFLSTAVGQQAYLDQRESTMESLGMPLTDEQYEALATDIGNETSKYVVVRTVLFPVAILAIAVIVVTVAGARTTPRPSFRQVLAVAAHSSVILGLQQLVVAPINYVRESISSPTNLTAFLPMLDEGTLLARIFGVVDLFYVWWIVVFAIGLSVVYRRPASRIAAILVGVYVAIAVVVAVVIGVIGDT
jgi:hypothetical protein